MYSRKNEAKAQAATTAIEMGAIEFIMTGDSDSVKAKKGLLLAPLDTPGQAIQAADVEMSNVEVDASIKEIEDCCREWRGGKVKPHWIRLTEAKFGYSAFFVLIYACCC